MGQVGLAGAFAGLTLFNNSTAVSFDPSTSSLLSRTGQGALTTLGTTNSGGAIDSGCAINDIFYFAGSFSSIGNTSATNIASYTPSSSVFAALGSNGPNGQIYSLYCDVSNSQLWVGGHFTSPGSSVAIWDTKSNSWSAPPFKGFSGAAAEVLSITSNSSENSLLFAGSFITSLAANTTALNNTNNPNVPYSPGATPFSSSLVPVPLEGAEILGEPSSSDPQFSDILNILCPAGPDGPGNTWLAANGNDAVITVRDFSSINAYGVRLGNTFQSGYGTTTFSVTSIPDNTVQTLTYVNPSTGQNMTCSASCPLSTDSSILYQDFIFTAPVTLTGMQITLSGWTGAAPGLHMLQLLSSGAFASAISSDNAQSCFAPNPSNTTSTGQWTTKNSTTNIPATLQTVLVSTVDVGTSPSDAPSFTWHPYVSASGQYDVYLVIPGCADFQDCDLRTSVQVTVFPGGGTQPWVSTVSQQVQTDTTVLVYSGSIVPSSTNFVTTVSMTLASNPEGSGQGGEYELVAGNVALVLTSASVTSAAGSGSSGSNSTSSSQHGFGFFEWPLSSSASIDATGTIPNTSETSLDTVSIDLYNALGATTSTTTSIAAVAQHPSGTVYLGGNFQLISGSTNGVSNIVAFKSGSLIALPSNGLNGPVTSIVLSGNELYVGGTFTDTNTASTQGKLKGVAIYDVSSNSWKTMGAGVNGVVASLALANRQIVVAGNFTEALNSSAAGVTAGGLATWDVNTGSWTNSGGFVVGNMSFVGNGTLPATGQEQTQFVAGSVRTMAEYGASGLVMLSNGGSTGPQVTPMGIQLEDSITNVSSPATVTKRHPHIRRGPSAWISHLNIGTIFTRQTTTTSSSALPPSPPAPAPAVLAGAFWTNVSTSHEVAIIGGNFSFSSSSTTSSAVAIYDTVTSSISALAGTQINGIVRAVYVDQKQQLFVGGEFSLTGTTASGLALYDLSAQQWDTSSMQPLQPSAGSSVVVRSITTSIYKSDAVIVAGSFAQAGSVSCQGICLFDTSLNQWSALGGGIQGDISSVSYAGNNQDILIAAGSITLSGGSTTNVAQYYFANATWAAVGNSAEIPGPVTAVEVNNGNSSSIFAAGRTADGSSPFMMFWDGVSWSDVGSSLQANTNISQLLMVPLLNTHSTNSIIESDRMLMISGALTDSSFGSASSVLFDGSSFIPFMVTMTAQGALGSISSLFYSIANFSFTQQQFLATGIVILISIAIAAGVVFLLALIGILWTLLSRRDDRLAKFNASDDDDDDSVQHRPSSLLEHINAATRTTILGAPSPLDTVGAEKEEGAREISVEPDPFGPDGSNYLRAETPSDAVVGTMAAEEEFSRPAHARYSFDGTGEGELPLTAGLEVEVLDDRDAAWWYTRNPQTGQEGVVPAAYLY
ncbi:cortical protein marker for cell polarity-domain-containing protein [Suillus paluster]|uniref:cortical protein marker for cell polarity-domain-containing protein n=1 Tax=Suillus paluster TaxID=48578 RepID=UPI001B8713EF|nr:cortical protein marker for cell polarity-domain-containing protein [Suillus paluster]KAG1735082.1 cortical protein marker for cell polarity-domain-containing protein [Suillus paluster]